MPVDATLLRKISGYERKGYQPDEIVAGLKQSQNYPDLVDKITGYEGDGYSAQEILDGMRTSVTPRTTEDLRQEFVRNTGTAAEQAKDIGMTGHTPGKRVIPRSAGRIVKDAYEGVANTTKDIYDYAMEPTAPAEGVGDWVTRVAPESLTKLGGRGIGAAYDMIKGQTDPIVKAFTSERDNPNYRPSDEMQANAWDATKRLVGFATSPLGFKVDEQGTVGWNPRNVLDQFLTDPAGLAVAGAGIGRPTMNAAKGAAKGVINAIPETAEVSLYKRGLKGQNGFNGLKVEELNNRVNTALDEGIALNPKGVEKLKTTVGEINQEIQARIKDYADSGATVNMEKVLEPVSAVRGQANNQAFPNKANSQINSTVNEFVNNPNIAEQGFDGVSTRPPTEIPINQAQAFKQSINRELNEFYDAMNRSPDKAGYLARQWVAKTKAKIADGLRAGISEIFPEVRDLNTREAGLIQLNKSLERAVNRIGQRDIISLKFLQALTHSPKTAVVEFIVNNPNIQSNLAIALRSARRGLNGVPKPGSTYTPPTITPRTPPDKPQGGNGRVNTLNLPKGEARTFDPTIGASRNDAMSMSGVNSSNLPKGEPAAFDSSVGASRPTAGGARGSGGNAGATQSTTYFDPMVGAKTTRRPSGMTGVNSLSRFTDTPSPIAPPPSTAKPTWKEFSKSKMGPYMKEEGGHGAAMKRLSKEYRAIVQDIQNKLSDERGSVELPSLRTGGSYAQNQKGYAENAQGYATRGQEGLLADAGALVDIPIGAPQPPSLTMQLRGLQDTLRAARTPEAQRAALADLDAFIAELESHTAKGVNAP
jgi:hypothetical protein